ncbi:MAG: hypothetical protein SH848_12670 [Saprospiraceae bacterium]|nr:hypothetical protein [Saprospiraceae bacterium]MDZ4704780.1 hypothetical protein [Saprospiraceae bacterium]
MDIGRTQGCPIHPGITATPRVAVMQGDRKGRPYRDSRKRTPAIIHWILTAGRTRNFNPRAATGCNEQRRI